MYQLIMNSNQIVHNRGRALAYLGNADKKRKANVVNYGSDEAEEDNGRQKSERHQYDLKTSLREGNPFANRGAAFFMGSNQTSKFQAKRRPDTSIIDEAHADSVLRRGEQ